MADKDLKGYILNYLLPKTYKLLPLFQGDMQEYKKHKKFLLIQYDGVIKYNGDITRLIVIRNNISGLDDCEDLETVRKIVLDSCNELEVLSNDLWFL